MPESVGGGAALFFVNSSMHITVELVLWEKEATADQYCVIRISMPRGCP